MDQPNVVSAAILMMGGASSAGGSRDAWEYQESDSNDIATLESEFHQRLSSQQDQQDE